MALGNLLSFVLILRFAFGLGWEPEELINKYNEYHLSSPDDIIFDPEEILSAEDTINLNNTITTISNHNISMHMFFVYSVNQNFNSQEGINTFSSFLYEQVESQINKGEKVIILVSLNNYLIGIKGNEELEEGLMQEECIFVMRNSSKNLTKEHVGRICIEMLESLLMKKCMISEIAKCSKLAYSYVLIIFASIVIAAGFLYALYGLYYIIFVIKKKEKEMLEKIKNLVSSESEEKIFVDNCIFCLGKIYDKQRNSFGQRISDNSRDEINNPCINAFNKETSKIVLEMNGKLYIKEYKCSHRLHMKCFEKLHNRGYKDCPVCHIGLKNEKDKNKMMDLIIKFQKLLLEKNDQSRTIN